MAMPACSIVGSVSSLTVSSPKEVLNLGNGVCGGFRNRWGRGVRGRGDSIGGGGGVDSREWSWRKGDIKNAGLLMDLEAFGVTSPSNIEGPGLDIARMRRLV